MKSIHRSLLTRADIIALLLISFILLPACGIRPQASKQPESAKSRVISVTSTPTGAIVRANGKKLGQTPLKVNLSRAFSAEWVSGENYGVDYRIKGELTLEKTGCEDYLVPVSDTEPSADISINLTCNEINQKAGKDETVSSPKYENLEPRLKKLEKLYQNGAISEDEYKQQRIRVLNEI